MCAIRKETLPSGWQQTVVTLTWFSSSCTPAPMWMLQTTAKSPHSWLLFERWANHETWDGVSSFSLLNCVLNILGSCKSGPVSCEGGQPVSIGYWMHEIYCHHRWQGSYWFNFNVIIPAVVDLREVNSIQSCNLLFPEGAVEEVSPVHGDHRQSKRPAGSWG